MRPSALLLDARVFVASLAMGALVACGSHPAVSGIDAAVHVDVAVDTAPDDNGHPGTPSSIYGPCVDDGDCVPNQGLSCFTPAATGFPNGECNRTCTVDDQCVLQLPPPQSAVDGYCQPADPVTGMRICGQVCMNGIDCSRSDGYTCLATMVGTLSEVDYCIAVCDDTTCGGNARCDHQSGKCVPLNAPPDTGREVGQSCVAMGQPGATSANQCISGMCSPAAIYDSMNRPTYTGFNGGSCFSYCLLPVGYNDSTIWTGDTFPQQQCPTGTICWSDSDFAVGDLGVCLPSCMVDSDCRASEGYHCLHRFETGENEQTGAGIFVTTVPGFCEPIDCDDTTQPPCPTGYTCQIRTDANGSQGFCVPASPTTM